MTDKDFAEIAQKIKLLSPFRFQLLRFVNEHSNVTVNGICEAINRKQSVVSVNLCKMHRYGILDRDGDGTKGYYRIAKGFREAVDKLYAYLHTDLKVQENKINYDRKGDTLDV